MVEERRSFPHGDVTHQIIGCFFQVFRELGHGFSDAVFRRAMLIALRDAGLHAEEEVLLQVRFRGTIIGTFRADLIVQRVVLVEIKANATIEGYAEAQLLNYLTAAGGGVGLLLNFGRRADHKRFVVGDPEKSLPFIREPEERR